MFKRATILVTAALFSGLCFAQQTSPDLELNLDQFDGETKQQVEENLGEENLELNLDQFKDTDSISLPADPVSTNNGGQSDKNLDLNLDQFDKSNSNAREEPLPQVRAETSSGTDTTGTAPRFKHTRTLIIAGVMLLAFFYWLSRRRRNRRA